MTAALLCVLLAANDVQVHIVSKPDGAAVMLDKTELGVTPLDAKIPPGKHTLTLTSRDYEPIKQQLKKLKDGDTLTFDFVAEKVKQLEAAVAKAQKSYDAAEDRLTKAQERESGVEDAEMKMSDAVRALEKAERELDEFKKAKRTK